MFRAVKLSGIAIVGILYFVFGIVLSLVIRKLDKEIFDSPTGPLALACNLLFVVVCIQVGTYYVRRLVKSVPFPLDGWAGYKHSRLIEINGGVIISYSIFLVLTDFTAKLRDVFQIEYLA